MAKGIEYLSGFCSLSIEDMWDVVLCVDDKRKPGIFRKEEDALIRDFRVALSEVTSG